MHQWLGLVLGAFLALIGLTGTVLVFHEEIDHALNPALFASPPQPQATRAPLDAILAAGERAAPPGWESAGTAVPHVAGGNYIFSYWVQHATPAPENGVSINVAVDPYTARVVGRRVFYHAWNPLRHCFVGFFFKLHYELVAGETGVLLVGFMACALIIGALAGLILWWPLDGKWRRVLTLKRRAHAVRLNHDLHQAGGFYLLPILLALLVTGLYFNLPEQFRWAVERFAPLAAEPAAAMETGHPAMQVAAGAVAGSVASILQRVAARYPGGTLDYITLTDPGTGRFTACYEDVPALRPRIVASRCLLIERASGRVVQVTDTAHGSAGDVFMQWQWPLHSGRAFGWTGRILVGLCGLVCPLLFVTGLIRWLQKRRAAAFALRRSPSRGDA
ncbi:MAG: PepSY-associated TM helix domain-containing protein [Steroidobacteraceae bacterium]